MDAYLPLLEEELGARGEDRRAPGWRQDELAPTRRLKVVDHRRGHVGPARRRTGCSRRASTFVDPREERRRRRHVAREHLSRLPGRQPEPQLQLLVRAAPRLAAALLDAGRAARLLPPTAPTRSTCASTSGSGPRSQSATWSDDGPASGRSRAHADGAEESLTADAVISAVGQLNRPNYPDDRRASERFAGPAFHSARWDHVGRPRRASGSRSSAPGRARCSSSPRSRPASASSSCSSARRRGSARRADYHDDGRTGPAVAVRPRAVYSEWNRFWIFWRMGDGALAGRAGRPRVGAADGGSVSMINDFVPADADRVPRRASSPTGPTCSSRSCPTTRSVPSGCCATTACGPAR